MNNEKKELLKPKYDVVFQALFGKNKDNITQSFISDILGEQIEIIDIKTDETVIRDYPSEKSGRLDLKTKFKDGTICQIEMQLTDNKDLIKRILYYWSKTYSKQLKRGEYYKDLKKTIGIVITNYEVKELEGIEQLDTKWQIINDKNDKRLLTEDLELHIIEIPKAEKILEKDKYNKIAQWLMFLDNPNTERVEEIMKENEEVKKANSVLYEMSEDEKLQRLAELREKWDLDERSARQHAIEEGLEEGRKKGMEQGLQEGIQQGVKKGEKNAKIEIAKKMKEEKVDLETIMKFTGISKKEIEQL